MNIQQKQFQSALGFLCIYKEAYKTIISAKKIFILITITMILPLSVSTFTYFHIMHFLLNKIVDNCDALFPASSSAADKWILHHLPSLFLWITFGIANVVAYVLVVSILYLLSTTTVLYTMRCLYSGKDLIFTKLLNVVHPKVSKRFLNYELMMLFHQFVVVLILISMWLWTSAVQCELYVMASRSSLLVVVADVIGCTIYHPLHLACVKSIFEDVSATQTVAIIFESNNGKWWFAHNIVAAIQHSTIMTMGSFYLLVVMYDNSLGIACKVTWGIIYILLHCNMILLGLVVQNIVYFKTYHGESNDKSYLVDHENEAYLAEKI
ncbi:hypothetical protein FRX31_016156 [Thalictrum thalictroides]|uniref:Uncharacterized protein n=1 Tax=Thalictrum thalictroides TaxID=46969 RepID=A0A7J6WBD3_THATH|nr:hypothetical protein FRX31_016156 [Thalictrum thalictroides]